MREHDWEFWDSNDLKTDIISNIWMGVSAFAIWIFDRIIDLFIKAQAKYEGHQTESEYCFAYIWKSILL